MKLYFLYSFVFTFLFIACEDDVPEIPEKNPPISYHYKGPGASSNDLLASSTFTVLNVEIQYVTGFAPSQAALNNLKALMESLLNKPGGIHFIENEIVAPQNSVYSLNDILAVEDENRNWYSNGDTLAVYFFFTNEEYSENQGNGKVLGIAYRNTSMVIFQSTIKDYSGGIGQAGRTQLESTVINHELGHILGLVNNGSNMQMEHQDEANGSHCDNENCLMHWVAETGDIVNNLIGTSSISTFDQNCLDDLKNNGGK